MGRHLDTAGNIAVSRHDEGHIRKNTARWQGTSACQGERPPEETSP